jgi:putative photosynthetic complex assembly protein
MRGLAQERLRDGIGSETPFTLTHWDDGTMSLADKTTGREIQLDAFGPTNSGAFAQIFTARNQKRSQIQ